MPKISGHHPYCHNCGDENDTPCYKWCAVCRAQERRKKRLQRRGDGVQKQKSNACGLTYVDIVDAADPKDTLLDGWKFVEGGV